MSLELNVDISPCRRHNVRDQRHPAVSTIKLASSDLKRSVIEHHLKLLYKNDPVYLGVMANVAIRAGLASNRNRLNISND